jgi:hypothetical protein
MISFHLTGLWYDGVVYELFGANDKMRDRVTGEIVEGDESATELNRAGDQP